VASDKIKLSRREDGCFQVRKGSLNVGWVCRMGDQWQGRLAAHEGRPGLMVAKGRRVASATSLKGAASQLVKERTRIRKEVAKQSAAALRQRTATRALSRGRRWDP
jgi:hypothetical protein